MIVQIYIRVDAEPQDAANGSYGGLNFSEQQQFSGAGFETVSKIFTRAHELLSALKVDHDMQQRRK